MTPGSPAGPAGARRRGSPCAASPPRDPALSACGRSAGPRRLRQTSSLPERRRTGQRPADDERVHLVRALVGENRLEVVHVPDYRVFERDPVAAEDRAGAAADLDRAADIAHLAEA